MTSLALRATTAEIMDEQTLPPAVFARVLGDIARVNAATFAYRPTLDVLSRVAVGRRSLRVLDVGFGHGDMLRRIARWARARRLDCTLVGIDIDPRSAPAARSATDPALGIEYLTGDCATLAGDGWDVIVSNMVAHHMTRGELIDFLRFMDREAGAGWIVNDLHRHRLPYLAYPLLARALRCDPIVCADGRLSIARGFRVADWHALLREARVAATLEQWAPFRLCVTKVR